MNWGLPPFWVSHRPFERPPKYINFHGTIVHSMSTTSKDRNLPKHCKIHIIYIYIIYIHTYTQNYICCVAQKFHHNISHGLPITGGHEATGVGSDGLAGQEPELAAGEAFPERVEARIDHWTPWCWCKTHGLLYGYGPIPIDTFLVGWTSIY